MPGWLDGWSNRIKCTIDHDKISQDISDFPVLITLTSGSGLTDTDLTDVFSEFNYTIGNYFAGSAGTPPNEDMWRAVDGTPTVDGNDVLVLDVGPGQSESVNSKFRLRGDFDIWVKHYVPSPSSNNAWQGHFRVEQDRQNVFYFLFYKNSTYHRRYLSTKVGGITSTYYANEGYITTIWYRFVRSGSSITTYYSYNGSSWTTWRTDTAFSGDVCILFSVLSYGSNTPSHTAHWSDLTISGNPTITWHQHPYRHKVAVTGSDGLTQWPVEHEWFDGVYRANYWTKAPTVYSGTDTTFYFYYDKTQSDNTTYVGDISSVAGQSIWDSNYLIVNHMTGVIPGNWSDIKDSTNSYNGTMTSCDGGFIVSDSRGVGVDFGRFESSYITYGDILNSTFTSTFTIEAYYYSGNQDGFGSSGMVANKWRTGGASDNSFIVYFNSFATNNDAANGSESILGTSIDGEDVYSVSIMDSSVGYYRQNTTEFSSNSNMDSDTTTRPFEVGGWSSNVNYTFYGQIYEVRISDNHRPKYWTDATNYTLRDSLISYSLDSVPLYTCSGTVQVNNVYYNDILVRLHKRSTGELVSTATTSGNGNFELPAYSDEDHYVIAFYDTNDTNALIYDWVNPEL